MEAQVLSVASPTLAPATDLNTLCTAEQIAAHSGFTVGTLEVRRARRQGPPYIKIGRKVRYRWGDYLAWVESRRQETRA